MSKDCEFLRTDRMNTYNGNVTTDHDGGAIITIPERFEATNHNFRYQLTVIGQFAQAIVEEEIHNNQFKIQSDRPHVKVSWQVTGISKDTYTDMHLASQGELLL